MKQKGVEASGLSRPMVSNVTAMLVVMAKVGRDQALPGFWCEDRHLSFFLGFLVLITIFVPMVGESRTGRIAIDLTFALMLFSGSIATVSKRALMYLIIALTILEVTADLIVEFNPSFSPQGWDSALKVFSVAILVVMT